MIKPTAKTSLKNASNRISRVATLDGGAVINHDGFSESDRSLRIKALLNKTCSDLLWNIFTTETMLQLSMEEGFYLMAIERMNIDNGKLSATILIKEKISS